MTGFVLIRTRQVDSGIEPELLHAVYATPPSVLSTDAVNFKLYKVHTHYNELDAIYTFNFQPSLCLYYVIIRIIGAGVSPFKILLLINGC